MMTRLRGSLIVRCPLIFHTAPAHGMLTNLPIIACSLSTDRLETLSLPPQDFLKFAQVFICALVVDCGGSVLIARSKTRL